MLLTLTTSVESLKHHDKFVQRAKIFLCFLVSACYERVQGSTRLRDELSNGQEPLPTDNWCLCWIHWYWCMQYFQFKSKTLILGKIEETVTTFTACWWFNIQYFSSSSNTVWQYCFVRKQGDPQTCTSFGIGKLIYLFSIFADFCRPQIWVIL